MTIIVTWQKRLKSDTGEHSQLMLCFNTLELAMVTTASSSARQPLTVTLESTSSSSQPVRVERGCASMCYYVLLCATMCFFVLPVNRHGVNSSWMLLVGLSHILVFSPLGRSSSREFSVTQRSFNWLSSLGWS